MELSVSNNASVRTDRFEMLGKFKAISDRAYDYQKALKEANLSQEDIDDFRSSVAKLENVPKTILDKQVNNFVHCQ